MKIIIGSALTAIFAASCALTPQAIVLNPEATVNPDNRGNGKKIVVVAVDERPTPRIGKNPISMEPDIRINQDVAQVVQSKISEALQKRGFVIKSAMTDDATELRVEVRSLEYAFIPDVFVSTLRTASSLRAFCNVNGKQNYEQLFRGGTEESVYPTPTHHNNVAAINKALSKAIEALLNDEQLGRCLAQ